MGGDPLKRPANIFHVIAGEAQLGPVLQQPGKRIQVFRRYEAAPVVPFLWPGVGKQHESAPDAGVGQGVEQQPRVVVENPDVGEIPLADVGEQAGHPVDVGLAADEADIGMGAGLRRQVLAGAEAHFQPNVGHRSVKNGRQVEPAAAFRRRHPQARQQVPQQFLPALAQPVAAPPAVPAGPVVAGLRAAAGQLPPKMDLRSSTSPVRSQEKPPSESGGRPKWP